MILALTANGPGEFAGWVRPLLTAIYAFAPETDVHVFCVPDDYASGLEAQFVRRLFPRARVHAPAAYIRFALGGTIPDAPTRADRVLYLGGDLMHAARLHARLGGTALAYKFSRKRYAAQFARVFAIDAANARQLAEWGVPPERVTVVGNLAIDNALDEARGRYGDPADASAPDGIVLLPGSRKLEVANVTPLFVRIALQIRRRLPGVPILFGGSPFASDAALAAALREGGVGTSYAAPATLERAAGGVAIVAQGERFPVARAAMRAVAQARLAVAIPGTKVIETAALGVPTVTLVPLNAPELVVINGPLQYVGRVPFLGPAIKRAAVAAVAERFTYFAQPNIDAQRELHPEIVGTILPSIVAHVVAQRFADRAWRVQTSAALQALYAPHAGAAERMARLILEPTSV